jgi:hypothetical protein
VGSKNTAMKTIPINVANDSGNNPPLSKKLEIPDIELTRI